MQQASSPLTSLLRPPCLQPSPMAPRRFLPSLPLLLWACPLTWKLLLSAISSLPLILLRKANGDCLGEVRRRGRWKVGGGPQCPKKKAHETALINCLPLVTICFMGGPLVLTERAQKYFG